MIGENRFNRRSRTRRVLPQATGAREAAPTRWNFQSRPTFSWQSKIVEEVKMGRGLLLWMIGIPIPIILLIWLFGGLHG